jgi:hypothetical protein
MNKVIGFITVLMIVIVSTACGTSNVSQENKQLKGNGDASETLPKSEDIGSSEETGSSEDIESNDNQGIWQGNIGATLVQYEHEDKISFKYEIRNHKKKPIEINFSSGKQFDFIIKDENGEKVYQHSDDRMYIQALKTIELKQGEALTYEIPVSQFDPGEYTIEVWLTSTSEEQYKLVEKFTIK